MQTYAAAIITETVAACPNARTAAAWVRAEADALIEQAQRRARGFDQGQWRDDCRMADRGRHNTIARATHDSVAVSFALSAKFGGL